MAVTLPIEPAVLVWARETAGYSIEGAADKVGVAQERLEAWEAGKARPGISHLRRLASTYKRPLPALFLARPPEEPPELPDFRRVRSRAAGLSPDTRFAIRDARRWQEIASEIAEDQERLGRIPFPKTGLTDEPEQIAKRIRDWLDVTHEAQRGWVDAREAFNSWRRAIEQHDVLVFVLSIPRADCRGFSVWEDDSLPVIVVNSQEVPEARLFTLFHEFTHLMLRNAGVCDEVEDANDSRPIETFCNQVAGFTLIPRDMLAEIVRAARARSQPPSKEDLIEIARRTCRTSRHVAAIRLEADGFIPVGTYSDLVQIWAEEDWRPQGTGGPVPIRYRILSEKGLLYSTLLVTAWRDGRLSSLDTSRLLEVRAPRLDEVAGELRL